MAWILFWEHQDGDPDPGLAHGEVAHGNNADCMVQAVVSLSFSCPSATRGAPPLPPIPR